MSYTVDNTAVKVKSTDVNQLDRENSSVKENDIYVLSPIFRLRNEHNCVKLYGFGGIGDYNLHHTIGIVLALCDGKRTVSDIAKVVVPFTKDPQSENGLHQARNAVCNIVEFFSKSAEEQRDRGAPPTDDFPSEAALVPLRLLRKFGRFYRPKYEFESFLPEHAFEPGKINSWLRDRVPSKVLWHLTSACATNCLYCYLKRRRISNSELLPFERVLEIIEECKNIGVLEINPGGGDILLYPRLFEFLDVISEGGFIPIRISTKAPLTKDIAKKFSEYDIIHEFQFSIDSLVEEIADYLVQKKGFCKQALESIQNALAFGLPVSIKAVITPYNILTIPQLYRELRRMGVQRRIRLAIYSRSGYHHTDDLFNHTESYEWLEKQLISLRNEFPDDFIVLQNGAPQLVLRNGAPQPDPPQKEITDSSLKSYVESRNKCTAGRNSILICADGKVIPCEQMPEIDEIFVGDLREQSLQEVWEDKKLNDMTIYPKEKLQNTPCADCGFYEACVVNRGFCIRDLYQYYGKIYATPPECPKSTLPYLRIT